MKKYLGLFLVCCALLAQQAGTKMPECGLGMRMPDGKPCQCLRHTDEVQTQYMQDCTRNRIQTSSDGPSAIVAACAATMPDHCSIVEHYGNWSLGPDGEHDHPMPQQCTRACTRAHCRCDDGPTCHFAHMPADDRTK